MGWNIEMLQVRVIAGTYVFFLIFKILELYRQDVIEELQHFSKGLDKSISSIIAIFRISNEFDQLTENLCHGQMWFEKNGYPDKLNNPCTVFGQTEREEYEKGKEQLKI